MPIIFKALLSAMVLSASVMIGAVTADRDRLFRASATALAATTVFTALCIIWSFP
jgi:hypothetical protein